MTRDEIRKKWQNGEFVGKQSEDNIAEGATLRPSNQRALNENKNVWQQVMDRTEQMMNTSSNLVQSDQYRISDSRLGRKVGGVLDKVFSGGKATKKFQQKDLVDEKNIRYNGVAARGDRTYNEAGNMFAKREKDYGKGNIDLNNRPVVVDGDGNISTVRSMSFYDEDEGKEVLIPTVVNGRIVSDEEAINHYRETGEYLGKFDTVKEADKYAEELHNQQEKMYGSNIKNKSLFEDAKDIGKAALLGARNVGEKQISYFENMTNEKFKGYRDFQKEAGIRQYLQESGKPLLTAYDKGETKILNEEVSENPTRDTIDSWMNSTEEELQSIINRQSNPVTKVLAELTPSMTQSALGTVVKAINPGMNIVYWLTSSGGDYVKSAQQRGITGQAANIYGTLLGSFDAAYEFVGNTITENAFGSGAKGTLKDVLKNMGIGAFENAVEEAVMEPTEEAVAKGFGGEYSFDDLPARMWEAGWKGAVSGAILDAASSGLGKATSIVTKANNKEMITTDDIRDALMEINKNEEYDLEKMLIDNFGTKSLDNLANGLYNIEGRQEKVNQDTKKRMEKVAEDINQDEAKKIMAKNTKPEEKQATTIENKPLLQQEQQTIQEETKEAENENTEQTEEIEGKEEEKPKSLLIKPKLDNELNKERAKNILGRIQRNVQYKENKSEQAIQEKEAENKKARTDLINNIDDYATGNNVNREQIKHIKNNAIEQGIDAEKFKSLSKEEIEGLMNDDIPKYKEENKVQETKPKTREIKLPEAKTNEKPRTLKREVKFDDLPQDFKDEVELRIEDEYERRKDEAEELGVDISTGEKRLSTKKSDFTFRYKIDKDGNVNITGVTEQTSEDNDWGTPSDPSKAGVTDKDLNLLDQERNQEEVKTEESADVTADDLNALDIERDKQRNLQNLRKDKSKVNSEVTELLNKENEVKERIKQNAKNEKIAEKMNDGYEEDEAREKRYGKIEQKEYSKEQSEEGKGYAGNDSYFEDVANYNNAKRSNRYKLSKKIERRALDSFLNSEEARKRVTEAANIDNKNYTLTKKDIANDAGHIKTAIDLMEKEGRFEEYENKVIDEARKSSKEPFEKKEGEPFTCVVVGSRGFKDYNKMKAELDRLLANQDDVTIVSGGANGADKMAERYAKEKGYDTKIIEADWKKYKKSAGYKRNNEMHKYAAENGNRGVVAFWDGKSNGTKQSFELSQEYGNDIKLIDVEDTKALLERERQEVKKLLEQDAAAYDEFDNEYNQRIQQAAQNNEEQGTGTTQREVSKALDEKVDNEDVETLDTTDMDKTESEEYDEDKALEKAEQNWLNAAAMTDVYDYLLDENKNEEKKTTQAKVTEPTTEELNDISRQQSNERKQQRKKTWQETRDRETRDFFEIDEESWNNLSEESKWGYRNRYKNSSDQEIDSNIRNKSVEKAEQMLEESNKALEEDDVIGILDGEVTADNLEEKDAERKVTARELWEEYKRNELKMNNKNDDLTFVTFDDNRVSSNEDKFNAYLDLVSPERFVSDLKKAVEEKNKADFKDTHGITESVYRKGQNVKDLTTRAELEQIDTALVSNDDVLKARTLDEFGNKDVLSKEDFRKNFNRDISTPRSRNSPMNIEYNRYLDEKLRMLYYDKVNEKYDIDDEFTQKEMRRIRSKEAEVRMKRLISDKYKDIVSRLLSGKTNGLGRDLKPTDIEERNVIKNPNGILAPIQRFGKALSYYISTPERINEMEFGHETGKFIQEKVFNPFNKALGDYVKFVQDVVKVVDMFNIRNGTEDSKYLHEIIDGFEYNDEGEQIGAFNEAILRQRIGNDEARINRILEARKIAENLLNNILDRTNAILKANGYSEIPRRKNYIPHFFNERINSIVEYMPKIIGSETQEGAGEALLELFKSTDSSIANEEEDNSVIDQDPSRPTSAHEKARTGTQTETDAVKALKLYAVNMGKLIYFTEHVQNFRALEKLLRQTAQLESTNYADSIYDFDNLTTEEKLKREQIRLTDGFKEYTDWLHSYINGILGVDTDIKTNSELINTVLNLTSKFMNKVSGRLGPNAVGFNMVTPHTNLIPLAKTIAQTNPMSSMKAIGQIAAKRLLGYDDGRMDDSYLWTRRQGIDLNLDSESITQSVRDASMYLMNAYDDFTTEFIVRAKYDEALNNLKKKAKRDGSMADADRIMGQAMDYADDFGSRMLAERTTGRTPLLFNNNFLRPITQFQIEPTNEAIGYLHDMRERYTKDKELFGFSSARSAANIAASGVNMVFLSQVFNNAFEAAFGSRPAIDLMEVIKIALGYDVEPDEDDEEKNKLVSTLKYLAGFSEEKNNKDVQQRLSEAGAELWSYMPIINQFYENARIPTFGAASDIAEGMKDFAANITNEDKRGKAMIGLKTAGKNFGKYFLLPTGGIQANRILETAATFKRGGNYTDTGELRYPVQEQDKTPVRQTQALLFGRKNLPTAKEYNQRYKNSLSGGAKYGKGKLSQEDTELYNSLEGVSYKDFTKVIDNPSSGRMNMLNNIDASESDKWKLFTSKVLSDKQGEKATAVVDNGLATKEEVMNNYEEFKERDISIPNEETIKKMKENDISFDLYSKYENDLKNMQDEQDRIKNTTLLLTGKDISKEKDEKDEFNVDTEAKIEVIRNDKYSDDEREKLYTTLVLGNGEENDKKRTKYNDFKKYGTGNSSEINKYLDYVSSGMTKKQELLDWFADNDLTPEQEAYLYATKGYKMTNTYRRILDGLGLKLSDLSGKYKDK